ncbi:hypothetical protein Q5Y75_05785 [Ruegeria sp. 2205SS24-7]|uniref:hypothetical protein n=1 Tax=Ruegeria discodermiae TaxID=3064389 RepID=UPI0027424D4F|nr:hypothetical protein [Ruegeria sp. 2205SS24-7]MDP5216722.1 hypothetical protein [Ruegeria sp. 2205SS24-7]
MDKRTLEALKASIDKWEKNSRVRKAENAKVGSTHSPLCQIYNRAEEKYSERCLGCPVAEFADRRWCEGTPYVDAEYELRDWRDGISSNGKDFRADARAEVEFLKSLLPEGEQ